jgi:hypothetical protein
MHSFQGPGTALEESNKYTQIVLINCPRVSDWLDGLIGPGELLLLVSHLFAVPAAISSLPPICSPNFSLMVGIWRMFTQID